ncbi:response regulator transcription factor [Saccharicrinis sp. FJH54]|uniref:response regulator transcription factor n=1 Tax=Saccharicrinis sp. FJH54 TaxID=3344665 RepID=UPI0035D4F132
MTALKHICFVEDDLPFGNVLKTFLELNNYQVEWYSDGNSAMSGFKPGCFDIAIIDVMLPHVDGFTLAKHIRDKEPDLPFVFLTARSMKEDILKGYKSGADDYITKPFDTEVLLYKIDAVLKRNKMPVQPENSEYQIGQYRFNVQLRNLFIQDEIIRISPREAELLELLISRKNELITRAEVLNKLWGEDDYFNGRSMDVFITKLRKRLQKDPAIKIDSIPRSGYILLVGKE